MAQALGHPPDLHTSARRFFDEFVEAFASFNGSRIAERYLAPYLAFHAHDSVQVFQSPAETGAYFQRIVDAYHAKGCRSCRYTGMEVFALGRDCAVATVTWELLAEDGVILESWRESYNLCLVDGQFKVFASTDHTV